MTIASNSLHENAAGALVGRRAMLGKIAVGGALVWASPLVTSTAHAQAAGTCVQSGTLRWNQGAWAGWASGNGQSATGQVESTGVIPTVSTTLVNTSPASNNNGVNDHARTEQGGVSYIEFGQTIGNATTWAQAHRTVRIDFGTEVTNAQFHIRDIDHTPGFFGFVPNWDDRVAVTSDGVVQRFPAADLTGPGTGTANAQAVWRPTNENLDFPGDSGGRATYIVSGTATWIEIHYWNGPRSEYGNILQQIWLSEISFGCI